MLNTSTVIWTWIILLMIAGIFLAVIQSNKNKGYMRDFAIKIWGKKFVLHYAMPFWMTICFGLIFNISLTFTNIESSNYSIFGMVIDFKPYTLIIINLVFSVLIFYLTSQIQRSFLHLLFSETFTNAMNDTSNQHFILQAFIIELYRQFSSVPNFTKHIGESLDADGFQNITDLLNKIKASGVKFSTYLYALLLTQSLSQKPSLLYSVWDTRIVSLGYPDDYRFYTDSLTNIYCTHLKDKRKKIRIFVAADDRFSLPAELIEKHRKWGFDVIYYCTSSEFQRMLRSQNVHDTEFDDFALFESGDSKWIIGRDYQDKKARICFNMEIINPMEKCFSQNILAEYCKTININQPT